MGFVEDLMGNLEGKEPLEYLDTDGRLMSQYVLHEQDAKLWIGFIWLRIVNSDVLLGTQQ